MGTVAVLLGVGGEYRKQLVSVGKPITLNSLGRRFTILVVLAFTPLDIPTPPELVAQVGLAKLQLENPNENETRLIP